MMAGQLDGSAILEAMKHRSNHKPIIFCSLTLVAVGILMTIFGAIVLLIDHAELGPPVYDSQYARYAGSSLAHILGPMFIGFGGLIIVGNFLMLAYASKAYYSQTESARGDHQTMGRPRETTDVKRIQTGRSERQQHGIRLI